MMWFNTLLGVYFLNSVHGILRDPSESGIHSKVEFAQKYPNKYKELLEYVNPDSLDDTFKRLEEKNTDVYNSFESPYNGRDPLISYPWEFDDLYYCINKNNSQTTVQSTEHYEIRGKKAFKMCQYYKKQVLNMTNGCSNDKRRWKRMIVNNGADSDEMEFRHMTILGYGEDWKTATWTCGGSLISERYVLTAGHCISAPYLGPAKFAVVGITKLDIRFANRKQLFTIKKIITEPYYHSPKIYNDIALLKLNRQVTFNVMLPACLHTGEEISDAVAEATGWGALGKGRESSVLLQKVYLQRFPGDTCSVFYQPYRNMQRGFDHNIQMCYGDLIETRSTCPGDSGGPLQVRHPDLPCMFVVIGVTSTGNDCGRNAPGIYTRVSQYVDWIEGVVWPDLKMEKKPAWYWPTDYKKKYSKSKGWRRTDASKDF